MVAENAADFSGDKLSFPKGLVDRILHHEIRVQRTDVLKQLLEQYPNEPVIIKMYADGFFKTGISELSAKMYAKAATLFLGKDEILSAIAVKLVQWQIRIPTIEILKVFFHNLKKHAKKKTLVNQFFVQLNPHEFIALLAKFKIRQYPPSHVIKKEGDLDDTLWFVVSGTLKDSIFLAIDNNEKQYRKPTEHLTAGDYFGDIYPFDQFKKCKSYIEAITNIELIGLSKEDLAQICEQHPNIELALIRLLKVRSQIDDTHLDKVRKEKRINLRLEFELEVFLNSSSQTSIFLSGYSKDVSIGGICFLLDKISVASSSDFPAFQKLLDNASVQVSFHIENLKIKIAGIIRWTKPILDNGRKTMAIGIQFEKISPKLKGLLLSFFNCFENS